MMRIWLERKIENGLVYEREKEQSQKRDIWDFGFGKSQRWRGVAVVKKTTTTTFPFYHLSWLQVIQSSGISGWRGAIGLHETQGHEIFFLFKLNLPTKQTLITPVAAKLGISDIVSGPAQVLLMHINNSFFPSRDVFLELYEIYQSIDFVSLVIENDKCHKSIHSSNNKSDLSSSPSPNLCSL